MSGSRKGKNGRSAAGKNSDDGDEGGEGDARTEGMDADVFSQPIGFIPQFPSPPKYIRVIMRISPHIKRVRSLISMTLG